MNFRQRFTRYLIGLGIGSLIVFMMFPDYDWFGWTPKKRIMENIREVNFEISPLAACQMQCLGVNLEQIQLIRSQGEVDFGKSLTKQTPKVYHLDYGNLDLKISLNDSLAILSDIATEGRLCSCP